MQNKPKTKQSLPVKSYSHFRIDIFRKSMFAMPKHTRQYCLIVITMKAQEFLKTKTNELKEKNCSRVVFLLFIFPCAKAMVSRSCSLVLFIFLKEIWYVTIVTI